LYRTVLPIKHLGQELKNRGIILEYGQTFDIHDFHYHAIIVHRIPPPIRFPAFLKLHDKGVKLIWELDDDLVNVPDWSPFKVNFSDDILCFLDIYLNQLCHHVIASTDFLRYQLAETMNCNLDRVTVLKNLVDLDDYKLMFFKDREPGRYYGVNHKAHMAPYNVFWSGSHSHVKDLHEVIHLPPLFAEDERVFFTFHGYMPPEFMGSDANKIVHVAWNNVKHYANTIMMAQPWIGLLPLMDHVFNKSKSNIKWLEMTLAGAACITSDICTYTDDIVQADNGFIVKEKDDWEKCIRMLIDNHELHHKLVKNAQQKVVDEFSWQTNNINRRAWIDFFTTLADS
jgi:glycosyltransferase involved in cell wall biosynthesis